MKTLLLVLLTLTLASCATTPADKEYCISDSKGSDIICCEKMSFGEEKTDLKSCHAPTYNIVNTPKK